MAIKRSNLLKEKEERNNALYSKLQKAGKMQITLEKVKDGEL